LKPLDQDPRLTHLAIQNIIHHPSTYFRNLVNNLGRLVFNYPYSFTRQKASTLFYVLPNGLILGALAIAAWIMIRMRRRLRPELAIAAVLLTLGFVVHIPLAAYARFVLPLIPVTVWLITVTFASYLRWTTPVLRSG
jgi:hypothetical protein